MTEEAIDVKPESVPERVKVRFVVTYSLGGINRRTFSWIETFTPDKPGASIRPNIKSCVANFYKQGYVCVVFSADSNYRGVTVPMSQVFDIQYELQ